MLNFFNSDICKLPDATPINVKHELSCVPQIEYKICPLIDWCAFNKSLDLEDTFKEQRTNNTIDYLKK